MAARPLTADTSVVIPVVCAWHEAHAAALEAAGRVTCLPAHVLIEAIAVLTRLPGGLAVAPVQAATVVRQRFPVAPLTLEAHDYLWLVETVEAAGLRGGQIHDALVASTAVTANALLLTRNRRAESTYRAVGAQVKLLR